MLMSLFHRLAMPLLITVGSLTAATLPEGTSADPIPTLSKPAKGVAFTEPTYGTRVVRVTDHANEAPNGFARNDYSRRQAFNADDSLQLVIAQDGFWHVYRTADCAYVKRLDGLAGDAEPQWHPTDPERLFYLPNSGVGMQICELNVTTLASRVVGDLGPRLQARWPNAAAAWTRSEGSPSADARYWCLMIDDSAWRSLGVICWDMASDQIIGWKETAGIRPDHVSMSPSGVYCTISGDQTIAYQRDFSQPTLLLNRSEHSDLAIDANGDDVYVAVDYGSHAGSVMMVNLRTGIRTDLFPTYLGGSVTALHISGKAFARPGWVLVSTYADSGSFQWLHRKLFAVELVVDPRIYQIAHTQTASNGYFTEPHASVNRSFTRVVSNSNWRTPTEDVDTYRIDLAADALPGSGSVPGDTTPPRLTSIVAHPVTRGRATITWTTDEAATGLVEYGTTTAYGQSTPLTVNPRSSHSIVVSGLIMSTTYHYRVHSRDAAGNQAVSADRSFTTTTNHAPIATAQNLTMRPGTAIAIALTGIDADGDALTGTIVTSPRHGELSGSGMNRTYTPAAEYSGTDAFTFSVSDGMADSAVATITISVTPTPDVSDQNACGLGVSFAWLVMLTGWISGLRLRQQG